MRVPIALRTQLMSQPGLAAHPVTGVSRWSVPSCVGMEQFERLPPTPAPPAPTPPTYLSMLGERQHVLLGGPRGVARIPHLPFPSYTPRASFPPPPLPFHLHAAQNTKKNAVLRPPLKHEKKNETATYVLSPDLNLTGMLASYTPLYSR